MMPMLPKESSDQSNSEENSSEEWKNFVALMKDISQLTDEEREAIIQKEQELKKKLEKKKPG
jgi:hypothetical protein